jgi:hypothetical protein
VNVFKVKTLPSSNYGLNPPSLKKREGVYYKINLQQE